MKRHGKEAQDNIPQRPFRRLSGSCSKIQQNGLFSVREGDDAYNLKDAAPKKPLHSASTIFGDTSTLPTCLEDEWEGSFSTPCQQALLEEDVKAREQPNTKVSTVPIPDTASLQPRKEMVEKYWSTLRERDLDAWRNLLTDDYQMVSIGAGGKINCALGMEDIIPTAQAVFDSLPDFRFMYRDIEESQEKPRMSGASRFCGVWHPHWQTLCLWAYAPH